MQNLGKTKLTRKKPSKELNYSTQKRDWNKEIVEKEQVLQIADKAKKKKKTTVQAESVLQELENCKTWFRGF